MRRQTPINISKEEFRKAGHRLIDDIAEFLESLEHSRAVTTGETPKELRKLLPTGGIPKTGSDADKLLQETAPLLFDHSLFNGHPKFLGYITASPTPIGILGDLLAAAVNPNCGGWTLSPIATEIELQTVRWIAEMLGYPTNCGGVLVSGGNMANFVGFLAARHNNAGWDISHKGARSEMAHDLVVYATRETHTWLYKALDFTGIGVDNVHWIDTDSHQRMDISALESAIESDQKDKTKKPLMVIGSAGTVSTGAVDPLVKIAEICKKHKLWFHVDGAYGAFAAALPEASDDLKALSLADSVAVDPHKWLYAPLEAGCALVRDREKLRDTFNYHPAYYKFDEIEGELPVSFVDFGPQNSRGFRALKVWLALRHVGRSGYEEMIGEDIQLSKLLYDECAKHPDLEVFTQGLSITTFRFNPGKTLKDTDELNELNTELLTTLQESGDAFVSNAVVNGAYLLRACVVNFRTSEKDMRELPHIIVKHGQRALAKLSTAVKS